MGVLVFGGSLAPFPLAPTLRTPVSGSFQDLAGTPAFSWQYNPGQAGSSLTQTGWVFDRLVNNSTIQQFWNSSTGAWQATPYVNGTSPTYGTLTNVGPIWTYAFPSGAFLDGYAYQWSIASQDANGTGPIASYALVTAQQIPVVTVYLPTGTIATACPDVVWSTVFAPGTSQTSWRLCIYNSAQQGIGGFTPGVSPGLFDSGQVGSNATDVNLHDIPLYLPTGDTYYFYVQITETHGLASDWAFTSATTSYTAPAVSTPTATASTDMSTGCPLILITAGSGGDNLLSADDADPALGLGTWTAVSGVTLSSDPLGMKYTPIVLGVGGGADTDYYAISASTQYTYIASVLAGGAGGDFAYIFVDYYDSGHTFISNAAGSTVMDNNATPTQMTLTDTSPSGAAYVKINAWYNTNSNDDKYISEIALNPGTSTVWTPGGGGGPSLSGLAIVQRSDGAYVRGASLTNPLAISGSLSVSDYEAVPGVAYTYSLQIIVDTAGVYTASAIDTSNSVTLTTSGWWELDPNDPSTAFNAQVIAWEPQVTEQSTAHLVSGQAYPNVVAANMGGLDGQATFETFDPDTYTSLQAMLQSQTTYFVSSPFGAVDTAYVRWGPQTGGSSVGSGSGNKVTDSSLLPSTLAAMHRTTAVTWVAQARPPV